ncbi:GSCOCG00010879001-RA-CDS, partial [Cotesia congregata]
VSKNCEQVIQSFEKDGIPSRLGLNAVSRNDLIRNHISAVAKKLHDDLDDKLILICDGTYARHEKSSNNEYQRKSYSGQKKVPLCKPFTICITDGYIADMLGPYYANQNDATIMRDIIDNPDGI